MYNMTLWDAVAERSSALDSSSGLVRMLGSNHGLAGRGACVGPVCCVMHVKEPSTLIVKVFDIRPCKITPYHGHSQVLDLSLNHLGDGRWASVDMRLHCCPFPTTSPAFGKLCKPYLHIYHTGRQKW